jgi:hypothetical protein
MQHQNGPLRLTGRTLGELALPDACDRCYVIKHRMTVRPPFSIPMPGIFSTIDSQTKRLVHHHFIKYGHAPRYLDPICADIQNYLNSSLLHWNRYQYLDPETGILMVGSPDDIFVAGNGDYHLVDYKCAKFTARQDELFPLYQIQLISYALIGESCGYKPMKSATLAYCEPLTGDIPAQDQSNHQPRGFKLGFAVKLLPVELEYDLLPPLLRRARKLLSLKKPPERKLGCEGCYAIADLFLAHDGVTV